MNLPKEWPEKRPIHPKNSFVEHRNEYNEGYNQCLEDCTAAYQAGVEKAKIEALSHVWRESKKLVDEPDEKIYLDEIHAMLASIQTEITHPNNK